MWNGWNKLVNGLQWRNSKDRQEQQWVDPTTGYLVRWVSGGEEVDVSEGVVPEDVDTTCSFCKAKADGHFRHDEVELELEVERLVEDEENVEG